jgi:uncharacterized protein with GYD domain
MAKYITFFSYSNEAARVMIDRPTDRSAAAKALVESVGGKLEAFYWMTGEHDGFLIGEYPSGAVAAALSVAAGSTGAVERLESYEIFDRETQAQIVKAAKTAAGVYKPPTS